MGTVVALIAGICLIWVGYNRMKNPDKSKENRKKFLGKFKSHPDDK